MVYDPDVFERFPREFGTLTADQRSELAWRSAMRLLPGGLQVLHVNQGIAILRQLLVAHLLMAGKSDRQTFKAAADAPFEIDDGWRPLSGGPNLQRVALIMRKAITEGGDGFGAAREAIDSFGIPGMTPAGHFILTDIQQIRHGLNQPWAGSRAELPEKLPTGGAAAHTPYPEEGRLLHPFWNDWYQSVLAGRPPDWDLLERVARIDDAIWQGGGPALDAELDRATEHARLLAEVRRLKALLANAQQSGNPAPGIGHNHPPGPVDAPSVAPELAEACAMVERGLDDAETELERPAPSPARLRLIGAAMAAALAVVARYCGSKADLFLTEAAKSGGDAAGKWAVRAVSAVAVFHLTQPNALNLLAEALKALK